MSYHVPSVGASVQKILTPSLSRLVSNQTGHRVKRKGIAESAKSANQAIGCLGNVGMVAKGLSAEQVR